MPNSRVLFLLKFRDGYGERSYNNGNGLSSGLLNSARFVVDMLINQGFDVHLAQVVDNNAIDREVHQFRPDVVIIEALWVTPEKFDTLQRLHPHVKWVVRGHSDIPFLANEGVAIEWLTSYVQFKNVVIAMNSDASLRDFRGIVQSANPDWSEEKVEEKVVSLPNYYPFDRPHTGTKEEDDTLDIASFGAIRPLKNQLIQAVAAIRYAALREKPLRFHVNATRSEQGGGNNLKNIRALFAATGGELVEHDWMPHDKFLQVLTHIDMLLQVSFSETFNIVTADAVTIGLAVVASPEVNWISNVVQADPTDSADIVGRMVVASDWRFKHTIKKLNRRGLRKYCERGKKHWLRFLLS
jgi:hypothetical protein